MLLFRTFLKFTRVKHTFTMNPIYISLTKTAEYNFFLNKKSSLSFRICNIWQLFSTFCAGTRHSSFATTARAAWAWSCSRASGARRSATAASSASRTLGRSTTRRSAPALKVNLLRRFKWKFLKKLRMLWTFWKN